MYTFNQELKRLEIESGLCQYCETEEANDKELHYYIPLFRENDRTNVIVYRSVKFSKIPVGIPRCATCKAIHQKAASKAAWWGWGSAVAFVILTFMIAGVWGIFAIFIGLFAGFFLTRQLENSFVRKHEIYTLVDGAKENEAVQELILKGWSFHQPMA